MALQEAEFDGDLWFFSYDGSPKIADIMTHPQVNVAFGTKREPSSRSELTGRQR